MACNKASDKAQSVATVAPIAMDAVLRRVASVRARTMAQEATALQRARVAMESGDLEQWRAAVHAANTAYASETTAVQLGLVEKAFAQPKMLEEARRVLLLAQGDPYAALGVPSHAPPRVVRKSKRELSLRLHPDKNDGHPLCEAATKALHNAFAAITRRASYQMQQ